MKEFTSNPEKTSFQFKKNRLLGNWKLMMAVLAAINFIFIHPVFSQTTTCTGATTITTVNAASCTPGTLFNISGTGTGPAMSTCNTGGTATNNWGQFVAAGTSATISYVSTNNKDAMIYAYSGTCPGSLTQIGCVDNGGNGVQENLTLTGLTAGSTYYVRIVRFGSTNNMSGNICIASQLPALMILTSSISGSPFCAGSNVSVSFTSIGIFSGNTYTAQLSNSSGIFTSPVSIGTLVSNANTGTISATIPSGTAAGTGYRIRVISSSPAVTGSDNGADLTINDLPQGSFNGSTICGGVGISQLIFTATSGTGPFTLVYDNGAINITEPGVISGTGFTPIPIPSSTKNYALLNATDNNGCIRSSGFTKSLGTITFSSLPTITSSATALDVCTSSSAQNSTLSYTATTNSPTQYAVTWNAAALAAGLVNLGSTAITSSPLSIPVAASVAAGTYTGTLTVTTAGGCNSTGNSFTVTVNSLPTITASATAASRCFSSSSQTSTLSYSATTNSPTNYTITWNAAALAAGLVNVSSTALPATPITFSIAASVAAATYTGTLAVTNANGCSSTGNSFTITVLGLPTITSSASAAARCTSGSAQTSTLSYSATTNTPTLYTITWNAAALAAGLTDVGSTALPATPITFSIAAGVVAGTYTGTLAVTNANGCSSTGNTFTITISSIPVMTSASTASVCTGGTVSIPLTSDISSNYTWIATSNANVTGESITTQSTSTLSNTLTLSTTSATSVIYTVTPTSTSGSCAGSPQTVTVLVNPLPTITASATATTKCFSSSGQTSTLSYSATTNSPTNYTITWNAAALAAGLVNVSSTALPATPITFSIAASVAAGTYTGTLAVTNANGCSSTGNSFTLTINAPPSITTQPIDKTVCTGLSASFTIAASGSSLTYQWRKGTTNITNGGSISGATTATLTINPALAGNAATDYNCVVSSASCSSVISNYVILGVGSSVFAPSAQPTALTFPTVGTTSIIAAFTTSATATNYLVVRTATNTAPTNPSNGTTYTSGTSALGGFIQYVGTSNVFNATGLTQGATYYFWIYAYNKSTCGTTPLYLSSGPLTGNVTTATSVSCGTVTTLYWGGKGSSLSGATTGTDFNTAANWSTSSSTYVASPVIPSQCNSVSLALNSSATITLSANAGIYNFTYTITGTNKTAILSTQNRTLTVNGDAVIDVLSGDNTTVIEIGENSNSSGIVDFKGNTQIGPTYFATNAPQSILVGNINSKITFRGDVLFGRTAKFILPSGVPGTGTTPGIIEFDGTGLQEVLWNNDYYYDNFYNMVVGNQNTPYVKHVTGTYTPDNILNNFTINNGATVDLATSQWIRDAQGGTLALNGTAKLILGNDNSIVSPGNGRGVVVAGSNFPGGFSTLNISSTSTIEYNAGVGLTQTVYGTPSIGSLTYGNLILSNGDGSGTANKITTSTVTVAGSTTVAANTTMTLGAGFVSNGAASISSGGRLNCGTLTVSGTGSFTVQSGGTLGMASTAGISSSGATGNVQTSTRNFGTGGNYVYYGSALQATGNGLPRTVNDLTIFNSSGVTMNAASANYTVAGTLYLTAGSLGINGDTLTINNLQRSSGTLGGSSTSSVGISGTSVPLFFTSGSRTLKNLFLNASASADLQTVLDITAGSSAGSIAVASGAVFNSFDNLTLKSDANGTARVAQIPVDGSGNALGSISGKVQIERYIPAKRGWRMMTVPVQLTAAPTINAAWQEGVVNVDLVYANNLNPNPGFGIHISGSSSSLGFDPTVLNNPSLMIFNRASSSWSGIPNTLSTTVKDYEGYMLFVRGNRSTSLNYSQYAATSNAVIRALGNLRTGKQTINLTGGTGSYSVVGNPFASSIDFRNVSTSGSVTGTTFVMWDPALTGIRGVGAYQYFTQTGGPGTDFTVFPGGGSYGAALSINNTIQSGQAFLIQNSGAGSVVINENAKVGTSTSTVFRPMPNNTLGRISVLLSSVDTDSTTTLLDGALTLYGNNFSDALDLDDAKKMINNSENFGISAGGALYQIEKKATINETDTIQYNMRSMKVKNYQFAIQLANLNVVVATAYLKDKFTNIETALNVDGTTLYSFNVTSDAASLSQDRFKIYFRLMNVLPVTFTNINAYRQNATIKTEWKVANEINVKRYEVEKSTDGVHFTRKQIETNVINNSSSNYYQWIDGQPQYGVNYYRVKSIDIDGREKYTGVAKVFFGKQASSIAVFPNPVTDGKINLYFTAQPAGEYTAALYNLTGQLIKTTKIQQAEGDGNAVIDFDNNSTHGNYILEIIKPDNSKTSLKIIY